MVNTQLLENIIKSKGIKKSKIVKTLNTSYDWLKKKMNNKVNFTADEMTKICNLLDIKDLELKERIFFADNVDNVSTYNKKEGA